MRKDLIQSKLGVRESNGYKRLWVEDSSHRLTRNAFEIGTAFEVSPRMGPGLNLRPSLLGSLHVSQRRGIPLLSLENSSVAPAFPCDEISVRISVGLITVTPSIRAFSPRKVSTEVWALSGNTVVVRGESVALTLGMALPSGRPALLNAEIDDSNLIAATDFIAKLKPGALRLLADGIAGMAAGNFLRGCGWSVDESGLFRR